MGLFDSYLVTKNTYRKFNNSHYQIVIYSAMKSIPKPIDPEQSIYQWDDVPKSPIEIIKKRAVSFGATFDDLWRDVLLASNDIIAAETTDRPLVGQSVDLEDNIDQFLGLVFQIAFIINGESIISGKLFELLDGGKVKKSHLRLIVNQYGAILRDQPE